MVRSCSAKISSQLIEWVAQQQDCCPFFSCCPGNNLECLVYSNWRRTHERNICLKYALSKVARFDLSLLAYKLLHFNFAVGKLKTSHLNMFHLCSPFFSFSVGQNKFYEVKVNQDTSGPMPSNQ